MFQNSYHDTQENFNCQGKKKRVGVGIQYEEARFKVSPVRLKTAPTNLRKEGKRFAFLGKVFYNVDYLNPY